MARIFAHNEQNSATLDELALIANSLHTGPNFHNALDAPGKRSKARQYSGREGDRSRGVNLIFLIVCFVDWDKWKNRVDLMRLPA